MMLVNSGGELYLKLGQSRLKNHVEECTYLYLSFQWSHLLHTWMLSTMNSWGCCHLQSPNQDTPTNVWYVVCSLCSHRLLQLLAFLQVHRVHKQIIPNSIVLYRILKTSLHIGDTHCNEEEEVPRRRRRRRSTDAGGGSSSPESLPDRIENSSRERWAENPLNTCL